MDFDRPRRVCSSHPLADPREASGAGDAGAVGSRQIVALRWEAEMLSQRSSGPWLIGSLVAAMVLGATYLYAVRGTVMLLDMAAAVGGMFCF